MKSRNNRTINAPCWLKLDRKGNEFTSYYAMDKQNCIKHETRNIVMAPKIFMGLVATSQVSKTFAKFGFTHVSMENTQTDCLPKIKL